MTTIKETLQADAVKYLKARNAPLELTRVRSILAAIEAKEKSGKVPVELSDGDVVRVLKREAAKCYEAAELFTQGGATERAAKETADAEFIESYIPDDLSEDEVVAIVNQSIRELQSADADFVLNKKSMGAVMKLAGVQIAGRFDGKAVSDIVKSKLV